jgi:hypothetical protein
MPDSGTLSKVPCANELRIDTSDESDEMRINTSNESNELRTDTFDKDRQVG